MRIFSIFTGLIYASVCFAQLNTGVLETTLNSTFSEVVGYFEFIEQCQVIDGDRDTCVIMNEEELTALLNKRAEDLEALNIERAAQNLEPLDELPVPTYRYLKIDQAYTDFDLGRIKASIFAQTTALKSNSNPDTGAAEALTINANLITDLTDTDDGRKRFTANTNIALGGNTLSVLKSIAEVYGECEITATNDDSPSKDVNGNILCVVMDGFRAAEAVSDLEKSIQTAANIARDAYGGDVNADSVVGKIFSSLKIETQGKDLVLSFELQTGESELTNGITDNLAASVVMTIKENGVTLDASGSALLEIRQVEDFTGKVKEIATGLSDRNNETHILYYEDNLYLVFGLIEAFLVVEEEDEDDDFGDDDF